MALIINNERIFGIDKEGGEYHEHPFKNPESHIPINKNIDIEEFIIESIEILKKIKLI